MAGRFVRNQAGMNYVMHARYGPMGRDLARRTVLVNLDARRRCPVGVTRPPDQWSSGHAAGRLKRSIHSDVLTVGGKLVGRIGADAIATDQKHSYALSVHEGSMAHPILPRRKRWLRWPQGGRDVFSRGVMHPGHSKGQPFLRNALQAARR